MRLRLVRALPLLAIALAACSDQQHPGDAQEAGDAATDGVDHVSPMDVVQPDVPMVEDAQDVVPEDVVEVDVGPEDVPMPMGPAFCTFPGSTVPGAIVPSGFCMREFAPHSGTSVSGPTPDHVPAPRNIAFAPNGDLFVSSPTMGTAGGAGGGLGGIYVVTDTDHNGQGEIHVFNSGLATVHGLVVADDAVYWTTEGGVWRTPYAAGQLVEDMAMRTQIATVPVSSAFRWTYGLLRSVGGRIYVTQGVWGSACGGTESVSGAIYEVSGGSLRMVSQGFRNPMFGRCHFRDEVCAVDELGDDGGGGAGAREKMLLIHDASNYGYPCCHSTNVPAMASCSTVTMEEAQMPLNDTPFGLDWERGYWPSPYRGAVFVAKHGSFYSTPAWHSAGIWWAPTNASTHSPSGAFTLLVDGFGPASPQLRRPSSVAFAPDGRLFIADDIGGGIYWVAPETLRSP